MGVVQVIIFLFIIFGREVVVWKRPSERGGGAAPKLLFQGLENLFSTEAFIKK